MSNAKPYLFGALLGASTMYVALQYHVVHSHDGFQMVPRTPQHSVGLAYADVRNWSPSQWIDRPELARALMAHGSSDLISESVAHSLTDSVAEENSTLDQLRLFLEESTREGIKDSPAGLLQIPSSASKTVNPNAGSDDDLTRIPFPQDAKNVGVADPFRVAQTSEPTPAEIKGAPRTSASSSRFSADDVLEGLRNDTDEPGNSAAANPALTAPTTNNPHNQTVVKPRTNQQIQGIEDQIFGSGSSTTRNSMPATAPAAESTADNMFEEVSTQLENRAQAALNRARETAANPAKSLLNETSTSSESYMRNPAEESAAKAAKSVINGGSLQDENKSGGSILEQFDPFLE